MIPSKILAFFDIIQLFMALQEAMLHIIKNFKKMYFATFTDRQQEGIAKLVDNSKLVQDSKSSKAKEQKGAQIFI